jgi:hypothetical protein
MHVCCSAAEGPKPYTPPPAPRPPRVRNPPWVQQVLVGHIVDAQPQVCCCTHVDQLHALVTHADDYVLGLDVTVDCRQHSTWRSKEVWSVWSCAFQGHAA